MPAQDRPDPSALDDALNPHRAEDRLHAAEIAAHALRQKGVEVSGDEDSDELATVLEAVEKFERAVAYRGGDSFTNSPTSERPERAEFVLPVRNADEGLRGYADRVAAAAEKVAPDATGQAIDPTRDLDDDGSV